MLITDGVYRMRFRDGFDAADTSNMVPNQHYAVDIVLPHTSITILQGHSLRIDVTSSNYPRFNRNMNTGQAMYPGPIATAGDTLVNPQIANNTIYTNSQYSSIRFARIMLFARPGLPNMTIFLPGRVFISLISFSILFAIKRVRASKNQKELLTPLLFRLNYTMWNAVYHALSLPDLHQHLASSRPSFDK